MTGFLRTHAHICLQAHLMWSPRVTSKAVWNGTALWFLPGRHSRGQQCFLNPFLAVCHFLSRHERNDWNFATLVLWVLFLPAALIPPLHPLPVSQSLDWVLMTVTAGHSGRPRSQLGGRAQSPPHHIVLLSLRPPPPPHPVWWRAALKHPVGHPSPHAAAPYRSVNPPDYQHIALCFVCAGPLRSLLMSS